MFLSILDTVKSAKRRRYLRNKWRELNTHNFTKLEIIPDSESFFDVVKVGKYTYGPIRAIYSYNESELLTIGNFCSIGSGTTFMLGSEHAYSGVSTFPFKVKIAGKSGEALTKGPICLKDDVWIGENVLVLSGVTIGQGAVVAAASVIVKDVPPYAIVGGNPARIIKFRFPEEIVAKLIAIDWSTIDRAFIEQNMDMLYESLTNDNVATILEKIMQENHR